MPHDPEHIEGDGPAVFRHVGAIELERIVPKHKTSRSGSTAKWLKVKCPAFGRR